MTNKTLINKQKIIDQTQKWLTTVVIEKNICPFANREYKKGSIHYEVIESDDLRTQLEQLIIQCESMDDDSDKETSLLILPTLSDFEEYLDLVEISTELMAKEGYEGIYQLASFHPRYRFSDTKIDDPSNYTNRSPYPMLHILRESSLEKALTNYPNPEDIPEKNIQLTRSLGLKKMKELLSACCKN